MNWRCTFRSSALDGTLFATVTARDPAAALLRLQQDDPCWSHRYVEMIRARRTHHRPTDWGAFPIRFIESDGKMYGAKPRRFRFKNRG